MTTVAAGESDPGKFEFAQGGGEGILTPEVMDVVSAVGNHEAKALLMVYLGDNTSHMKWSEMGKGFKDFIGDDTEWKPIKTQAFDYCERSFETVGQVVQGQINTGGRISNTYAITEKGEEIGLPLAGLLLRWSLEHPEISVQQLFGATQSRGNMRAAQNRIELIAELVTGSEQGLPLSAVAECDRDSMTEAEYDKRLNNIRNAADVLERHGFVTIDRITENNNRQFVIEDPIQSAGRRKLTGDIASTVYKFMGYRFEKGETTFDFEECLSHVTASFEGKDIDEAEIRERLTLLLVSNTKSLPGLKRLETFNDGAFTKVTLNEEHREALEELIGILVAIDDKDATAIEKGLEAAREIADDSKLKGWLMTKAKRFSPAIKKKSTVQTADEIYSLLKSVGEPVDTSGIIDLYEGKFKRTLSKDGVQVILRKLSKREDIEVSRRRPNPSIRTTRNFYAVVEVP